MNKITSVSYTENPTVLIGSCGGLTGSYLCRQFKDILKCYVIGADVSNGIVTKHFCDESILLPNANDSAFVDSLIAALVEKEVDIYLPTHSTEVKRIAENEQKIRKNWKGFLIISPKNTFELLDDKYIANQNLHRIGIPVPRVFNSIESIKEYPVFMKPNNGSGSKNSFKVESKELCEVFSKLYPESHFYAMISGEEYTCDCMFDQNGQLLGYNQRARLKNMGGAVIITKNQQSFDIFPYLVTLQNSFLFKGCVNFQYIVFEGKPYFIDINLRYASGGLPLSVNSGLNVPDMLLRMWKGEKLSYKKPEKNTDGRTMYRYFNEIFEDAVQ